MGACVLVFVRTLNAATLLLCSFVPSSVVQSLGAFSCFSRVGRGHHGCAPSDPATDTVGDNVHDIAGMGDHLFRSFAKATCAALVLVASSNDLQSSLKAADVVVIVTLATRKSGDSFRARRRAKEVLQCLWITQCGCIDLSCADRGTNAPDLLQYVQRHWAGLLTESNAPDLFWKHLRALSALSSRGMVGILSPSSAKCFSGLEFA